MPNIFIISGPSRSGKNAIIEGLLGKQELNLERVITATTRRPRGGERQGQDYYFFNRYDFEKRVRQGYFLEWAILRGGEYFGTPASEIERIENKGKNIIWTIDVQGAKQVRKRLKDKTVLIFIKPEFLDDLKLRMRKAGFNGGEIKIRLDDAKREFKEAKKYDYVIINREGELNKAIEEVRDVINKFLTNKKEST